MSFKYAIALAAFFAFASAAQADKMYVQVTMSKADFDALKTRMIGQLDSDRDTGITPKDKAAVIEALDRIDQHLAKSTIGDQDRMDIFNDQELINQITTHAAEQSRLHCERDAPAGSHVKKITCMTLANWTERTKVGQTAWQSLADNYRSHCSCIWDGPGPGP